MKITVFAAITLAGMTATSVAVWSATGSASKTPTTSETKSAVPTSSIVAPAKAPSLDPGAPVPDQSGGVAARVGVLPRLQVEPAAT